MILLQNTLFLTAETFARQTGEMVGLNIPVIPVEHQYIVTEPHPEIQEKKKEGSPRWVF